MTDFSTVEKNLKAMGYEVKCFADGAAAAAYLNEELDGTSIGIGGSRTIDELGLYESLKAHNEVYWHFKEPEPQEETFKKIANVDVYMASVNALAETGAIVNMDGTGNRITGTLFGHRKVIYVVGRNKLTPDEALAIHRVRQVICPRRANDWDIQTPCVLDGSGGTRCYDCKSPDRICRAMVVQWMPMLGVECEVILIDEDLGY